VSTHNNDNAQPELTKNIFGQAAGDVIAQRMESLALEVRSLGKPRAGAYSSDETLGALALTLKALLRRIDEIFEFEGFSATPARNIMLELFQARVRGGSLPISGLCQASGCSAPVVGRWVDALEGLLLVEKRQARGNEARVALTERGYIKTAHALHLLL
jgi:hypothetical protein